MYPILEKRLLAEGIWLMKVLAPRVARSAQPGQFVIVRADEHGERIPLTISDFDAAEGSVTIVTQAIGASTRKICALNEGDALADFAGPLGHPSEFVKMPVEELRPRRYLFVAGGVGTAPVYPQVKWLREHGVKADVIIGAKTRDMLIYTDAMRAVAENLHIATDDGSEGFKGLVTALIGELIEKEGRHYDECVAIGPMIMMKFVALTTKKYALKTTVSLNALMVDGTGMCGACRVTVGGRTRFTCVDGPEFDAHEVDFDEAMRRQGMYRTQEQRAAAIEAEREAGHVCKVGLDKSKGERHFSDGDHAEYIIISRIELPTFHLSPFTFHFSLFTFNLSSAITWQTKYPACRCANRTRRSVRPISRRSATATTSKRPHSKLRAACAARIPAAWRPAP